MKAALSSLLAIDFRCWSLPDVLYPVVYKIWCVIGMFILRVRTVYHNWQLSFSWEYFVKFLLMTCREAMSLPFTSEIKTY